jgi:hypothetical protein
VIRFRTSRGRGVSGLVPGNVVQFAEDGDRHYALVVPQPSEPAPLGCDPPNVPCTVVELDPPALTKTLRRPGGLGVL